MYFLRFISILMILCFSFASFTQAQQPAGWKKDARKVWLKGFEFYEKGEKSRQSGQIREALTLYKEALRHFNKIKTKYPTWNTAMIKWRIEVCNKKLKVLKVEFDKKNIKFTETETDRENLLLKTRLAGLEKELSETKSQLDKTYVSLEAARREAARNVNVSKEVDQLIKEKTVLRNRCTLLEDQYKKLQQKDALPTAEADKKSLDKALLQIETMRKDRNKLISMLETEKQRYVLLVGQHNDLTFKLKKAHKSESVTDKTQATTEKHVVVLEKAALQAKKEKETAELNLKVAEESAKQAKSTIKTLKEELKKVHTDANVDVGAITQKLSNDNELILKSLETANIKLIQKAKQIKDLEDAAKISNDKITLLKTTLAGIDENREKIVDDLKMMNKKVFITDTITKKQDQTIIEQKEQYEKLKKDFDALAKQVKQQSNKEKEFTALAKQSLLADTKSRKLQDEAQNVQEENKKLVSAIKQIQINLIKSQKDYKEIVNDLAKSEQENFKIKVSYNQENLNLSKKCSKLTKKFEKLTKSTEDYDNKMELLTDELVSINSSLVKKEKELEELKKLAKPEISAPKNLVTPGLAVVTEPVIINKTPQFVTLKRENNQLLAKLNEKEDEIRTLKQKTIREPKTSVDQNELDKLLKNASDAEKNSKNEAAIWYYEKVLKQDPYNAKALSGQGMIEAANGNDKKAIPLLVKSLVNDPDNMDLLLALTFCYIRQEKYYEALGAASRASAKDPKDSTLQRYMGIICSYLGWNDAAERQFRMSFKLDPTSSETAYNAAVHIAKTSPERKDEAKLWYNRAIQLGAQHDPVMEKLFK